MNIRKIELSQFMSHDDTEVALPENGIVLVTGMNGAGKSSFVEAVASSLWGKTLRSTPPWREDTDGIVAVATDLVNVRRIRSAGGKVRLEWSLPGSKKTDYETTAKAQEALESVVGQMDIWRRCSVFSSSDAAHFTMATDGERKRLLEAMLGLERFDAALDACRADLKLSQHKRTLAEQRVNLVSVELTGHQERLSEANAHLATLAPAADTARLELELRSQDALIKKYDADVKAARSRIQEAQMTVWGADREVQTVEEQLRVAGGKTCPTCGQNLPARDLSGLRQKLSETVAAAQESKSKMHQLLGAQKDALEEMEEEREALVEQRAKMAEQAAVARSQAATRKRLETSVEEAGRSCAASQNSLSEARSTFEAMNAGVKELEAVETVLGLKGVRAHILGRALSGVEQVANAWLARIADSSLRVVLKPYSEKKSGGISDSISFEIEGAGGGYGYRAASGGERRRIDIACLLALAEIAQQAHGQPPGTLFFDEVFDALDAEGVDAVAAALRDIARNRAVVVISHSEQLMAKLDWKTRLSVASGRADVVSS